MGEYEDNRSSCSSNCKGWKGVYEFGPLNKAGGERRLNVAITRARYEMKVFSTLTSEQIDERRTQAEGREDQTLQVGTVSESTEESVISHQIAYWLNTQGYESKVNVETSGCRVDVAVINPRNINEYRLGILCDGDNYYKLKTVRDREIVRPAVFNRLGWHLVRVSAID